MADSPATDPLKPGAQTSEHGLAKLMAIIGTVVTVVGAIVPILSQLFSSLHEQFPNATWITSIAGALMATAPVVTYILSRASLKSMQVKAGAASDIVTAQSALKTNPT